MKKMLLAVLVCMSVQLAMAGEVELRFSWW